MDTRTNIGSEVYPFGNHPDGGKISELRGEIPNHMMPLSEEARKILEKIPLTSRLEFVYNSTDPRLEQERKFINNKLKRENPEIFAKLEYNKCRRNFRYWYDNYFVVKGEK